MRTYGLLYSGSFDPSDPSQNLIISNNGSADDKQFFISVYLESSRQYVLVVSTSIAGTTGGFFIRASGPTPIFLSAFFPSTSRPIATTSK